MPTTKTAIVTGATGKIGTAIARQLASMEDIRVIVAARDETRAQTTVADLIRRTGNENISFELVDVSRRTSIDRLSDRIDQPLDILINNAAVTPRKRLETPEGIELQWATNVLGYVWMMQALTGQLSAADSARIVNVASHYAGGLRHDDPEFKSRRYDNNAAYRQSKQANRMLTVKFADLLSEEGITVNACHPGEVNSKLSNNLGFGGHESPDTGAQTPVWLATDPLLESQTGGWFSYGRRSNCAFSRDLAAIESLYDLVLSY